MDCSTRKGKKVKGIRIEIQNSSSKINNTKQNKEKKTEEKKEEKQKKKTNNQKYDQFGESSGLTPLVSSPGIGTYI
jgi:hypothetical protein